MHHHYYIDSLETHTHWIERNYAADLGDLSIAVSLEVQIQDMEYKIWQCQFNIALFPHSHYGGQQIG